MQTEKGRRTAFILELIILFLILVMVISVFTQVFLLCRSRSAAATRLTGSVILAASVAEAASTASSDERLEKVLSGLDNKQGSLNRLSEDGSDKSEWQFAASIDNESKVSSDSCLVRLIRRYEGDYADDTVYIYDLSDSGRCIYSLRSGTFFGKEAAK